MTQVEVPAPANDLEVSDTWSDWRRPPPSSIWEKWECMEAGRALVPVLIPFTRKGPVGLQPLGLVRARPQSRTVAGPSTQPV